MDYNKFPKYPKRIVVFSDDHEIAQLEFIGFLVRLESKRSNIQFQEFDIFKGFDPNGKKTKNVVNKNSFNFPNYDRVIHIFNGYDCVAEIDIRGIIHKLFSPRSFYSFHIQNIDKDYLV